MNPLDSFTVERLEVLSRGKSLVPAQKDEVIQLAKIALAAKLAKAVAITDSSEILFTSTHGGVGNFLNPEFKGIDKDSVIYLYTTPLHLSDEWIKCSEQMPGNDEMKPIAIFTGCLPGQGMFVATYDEDGFFDYWEGVEIIGVSHWMPLPAAPKA